MAAILFCSLASLLLAFLGGPAHAYGSLIVDVAPDAPRPYVLPNLKGEAVDFGGLIIRTLVSNSTSAGALSVLGANAGPLPLSIIHSHKQVETFYTLKGSVQVFHNANQGRELRADDFALLAAGSNHTYRFNELDFQLSLVLAPGGVEGLFNTIGNSYRSSAPFNPEDKMQLNVTNVLELFPRYGITPALHNTINLDWTNGTTHDGLSTWHVTDQTLPDDAHTPYFVSSNRGPKYLQRNSGQVVQMLASGKQTDNKLTVATVAMKPGTQPSPVHFDVHQALQVTEGQLHLEINNEAVTLIFGDLAFIPKGTSFSYWSTVGFTKFVTWSAGAGLADSLVKGAKKWDHAVWPA
ncbi:hypothetical protein HRR83_005323 [Exophiala dermatitidis]|uniref:Quercetin 2,3-dioxygenase n=2 Tax=Exophiala dermatitidis TaxID=5970 RepID=H6C1N7_EXODN|nr:uncharacterized protein HMPREF1120_05790 [Exophiala dermatitidis NIH/UT8656]KAJ4516019.1 hypothetical protein HRR74_005176 [Exophiala dermatitidis]EHY57766.1 hypothetical protein HMPREF1120_05790 [Exophiala dermatitidis NIH/UT8656]KAJ4518576.1 hypothetical protein HRR73_004157 [Exophiala dermatitidis]KAJ4534081.1 hypothetical protein HRR76_006022 [Exophiala dermatitidis]KAJ4550234.1 hypothetical protein HRR77_003708 [Exophiala dermatitidis]